MPNWCSNNLSVSGDAAVMNEFYKRAIKTEDGKEIFRLSHLVETPEELLNTVSPTPSTVRDFTNEWEVANARQRISEGATDVIVPELIPCNNGIPEKAAALKAKYGYDNWYDWNVNNWGVKWDCEANGQYEFNEKTDTDFDCFFDSAWTAPTLWLEKVAGMFPTLNFRLAYQEEGMGFCGLAASDGEGGIDIDEGDLEYRDDQDNILTYDSDLEEYVTEDGDIVEDAYAYNPFDE